MVKFSYFVKFLHACKVLQAQETAKKWDAKDTIPMGETLYPELFLDSCEQQEAALKALISTNKECDKDKRWRNFKRLRRIQVQTSPEGVIDPTGIGQMNCVAELLRQGTNVDEKDIVLFCQMYIKLKAEKSMP